MSLIDNIFNFPNVLHVQRDYNWDFILPSVGLVPGVVITKYCQSVSVGQYDIREIIEQKKGAKKTFYPGQIDVNEVTATFIAPTPDIVSAYFHAWKQLIIDKQGFYGLPSKYKKNATVVLYDRTMSIPTNLITIKGMWPTTFPKFTLDYNSEGLVVHSITFKFDDIAMGLDKFSSDTLVGKAKTKATQFVTNSIDKVKNIF